MQRTRWTSARWGVRARHGVALTAALAMVLAGCGDDPDAVEIDPAGSEDLELEPGPDEESGDADGDAATEPEADDLDPSEGDEDASGGDGTAQAGDGPTAAPTCELATTTGDAELAVDAYEQVVLETNFELELLVMDIAADLDEMLSGVSDGSALEQQLIDHQARYVEATGEVAGVQPPDGAEDWHERAMESFDAVCVAIADGRAGSVAGEDERFEDFVAALTEFPGVLNQLHANAACGPFEEC